MVQSRDVNIVRVRNGSRQVATDTTAVEEPLEVRLHGRRFATIMRTPGDDTALAAGFLLSEQILKSSDDLGAIEHCRDADAVAPNVVNVTLAGDRSDLVARALDERRNVTANASCGLCGRLTIDSLSADLEPVASEVRVGASMVVSLPARLRRAQPLFDATGGLHAAGLFAADGSLLGSAEDIGRHNAVDKVIGAAMQQAWPLPPSVLVVSGRQSFEVVQKAAMAGVGALVGVSAPSSLAVELADELGMLLVGFARGDGFNVYAGAARLAD